jgi:predicted lipoprotein with Yx(FWY)xxD motif
MKPGRARRRARFTATLLAGAAGFALAALTGIAIAKSFTVKVAKNVKVTDMAAHVTKQEAILVDSHGVAVYTLSGETTRHLLCTSSACLGFWPPVKVRSGGAKVTKAPGVKGRLGILHRNRFFQLTLNGHPLYNFTLDAGKKGIARGEAIVSFGGTWHAIKASSSSKRAGAGSPTTTATTTNPYPGW